MKYFKKIFITLLLSSYFSILLLYLLAYTLPIPNIGESERLQIYDINDTIYFESNFDKNSSWITIDDIPDFIKNALNIVLLYSVTG